MAVKEKIGRGIYAAPTNTKNIVPQNTLASSCPQTALTDIRVNPSQIIGPTGIKFPFRFAPSGRVAVSTTNQTDTSHVKEAIEQILFTSYRERFLLSTFGSPLSQLLYEPQEEFQGLVESEIIDALQTWAPYVQITSCTVTIENLQNRVYIILEYIITSITPSVPITQIISLVG